MASGRPGRVELTEAHGHARELARQAVSDAAPLVMAWGGDGTVNEVGTVLAFGTRRSASCPAAPATAWRAPSA